MPDMLVKLYEQKSPEPVFEELEKNYNVIIRKPIGPENYKVIEWIRDHFGAGWAGETENAFFNNPKTVYIATRLDAEGNNHMLGFACYDATVRGFFGPTGVDEAERGHGIGKALLLACLDGMKNDGYGYCIIGSAGPVDFYKKCCGATVIEGSSPGVYRGML